MHIRTYDISHLTEVTDIATLNVIKNQFECLLCSLDFEEKCLACLQSYCDKHVSNHDCKGEDTWMNKASSFVVILDDDINASAKEFHKELVIIEEADLANSGK